MGEERLSYRLSNSIKYIDKEHDEDFRNYIQDHKQNILNNSTLYTLDPDTMASYQYLPEYFLTEVIGTNKEITWIFLYINNLISSKDFSTHLSTVYIPDYDYLIKLQQTYKAILVSSVS